MPEHTAKTPDETHWKCPNCRNVEEELADDNHHEICPNCRVESMDEMEQTTCPDCGGSKFDILQPTGFAGSDPTATCLGCGRTAQVDDEGLWW